MEPLYGAGSQQTIGIRLTHCRQNGDNRAMDQLRAMEIFVEVARLRSFTAAGRRLGLTRAMVSKHIMQLEERLPARLLHRSTRDVSLTDVGQAYLEPCMATVAQAQEAARVVTLAGAELAGP